MLFELFHLFPILLWHAWHSQMVVKWLPVADQPTSRCITRHPLFETICLQREGLETAIMGLCHVHGMRAPRVQS